MKFKVTVILKNGTKYQEEYTWNKKIFNKEIESFLSENLNLTSNSKVFCFKDDKKLSFYYKDEIAYISVENIG